jgi:dihydroorotate dehydrogenase
VSGLYGLARPLFFAMDAEQAHGMTIKMLKAAAFLPFSLGASDARLRVKAFGLDFPNPVGMAAGFDKHAEVPDALLRLGFGFTEIGTVTPLPQPGNPLPRLFRLTEDEGVINRFGFNSEGHRAAYNRLAARAGKRGIVGVNVGANKDAADRVDDYVAGIEAFADVATYFTVNISSPNTPGLRDLQQASVLDDLLARVLDARDRAAARAGRKPILLKIAPDLTSADLDDIVRVCRARKIDGMIVGNTTITRPASLRSPHAKEGGGLSGKPLFELSTHMLAQTFQRVEGQFPIIGAGGIHDAASAIAKIEAGASLLQFYSAMVYRGPGLVAEVLKGLRAHMDSAKISQISALTGRNASEWANRAIAQS